MIRKRILRQQKQLNSHVHRKQPPSILKAYFKEDLIGPQTTRIIYNWLRGYVINNQERIYSCTKFGTVKFFTVHKIYSCSVVIRVSRENTLLICILIQVQASTCVTAQLSKVKMSK